MMRLSRKAWSGASLPRSGESSYCFVLKGIDKQTLTAIHGRKRTVRHTSITSDLKVSCVRRYLLSRGSRDAAKRPWSYPEGKTIAAHSVDFYTVFRSKRVPFASFTDVAEAFLYCNVLRTYDGARAFVVKVNR